MTKSRECGGFIWAEDEEQFLQIARRDGWKAALKSVQEKNAPDKLQEAIAPNRLAWISLVDVDASTRALDVGAGTGGLACQLAERCHVVAVDGSEVDVEFMKIRSEQDHLSRFTAVVANAVELPFDENQFDLVTMNGVLEWVATSCADKAPREAQLQALKEIRRVLRPDGKFLLGIENRYALDYFCGVPEPHVGLKYISLMERDNADQFSRSKRGLPFSALLKEGMQALSGTPALNTWKLTGSTPIIGSSAYCSLNNPNAVKYFVDNLLKPQDFSTEMRYSMYLFYRFCDPVIVSDFVGHFGFLCH
jgi:SAM-dependent methyltransferase